MFVGIVGMPEKMRIEQHPGGIAIMQIDAENVIQVPCRHCGSGSAKESGASVPDEFPILGQATNTGLCGTKGRSASPRRKQPAKVPRNTPPLHLAAEHPCGMTEMPIGQLFVIRCPAPHPPLSSADPPQFLPAATTQAANQPLFRIPSRQEQRHRQEIQ